MGFEFFMGIAFQIGQSLWDYSVRYGMYGFSTFSSGGHFFSGAEPLGNFGKGAWEEHFCEIILKSGHWPGRRCHLKFFLFLALVAILFNGAEEFWQFW